MRPNISIVLLLTAALLEVAGDALIRSGLQSSSLRRLGFFAAGAIILFSYGVLNGGAIIDPEAPRERRFVAVKK